MIVKTKTTAMVLVVVFLLFIDRLAKTMAIAGYFNGGPDAWLFFNYNKNFGIAFSLPLAKWLIVPLVFVILLFLSKLLVVAYKKNKPINFFCYFLVIIGSVSNLYDRIRHGFVIDYLEVRHFSVLNLSDVMIFCGVVFLAYILSKEKPAISGPS